MGDIATHAEVTHEVMSSLHNIIPGEDYGYIELGNYLSDVSQFRDPAAMFAAKLMMYRQGLSTSFPGDVVFWGIGPGWIDDVMGSPGAHRHGALSEFFECVIKSVTFNIVGRPGDSQILHGVTEAAVDRLWPTRFTQYFPHEHLDFPPLQRGRDFRQHPSVRRSRSGLLRYLEVHRRFVSETLTNVEHQWKNARLASSNPHRTDRHDALVTLGHALHVVEDYFFHSNFAELQWYATLQELHRRTGAGASFSEWFEDNALGHRSEGTTTRFKRKFDRRLKYPTMNDGAHGLVPSRITSAPARDFVYTGGFGSTDLYHTLYGALHGIEHIFEAYGFQSPWALLDLVLIRTIMSEAERILLVGNDEHLNRVEAQHREQLRSRSYEHEIERGVQAGFLTARAGDELRKAYEVDRYLTESHSEHLPGLGGFILRLFARVQEEAMRSEQASDQMDRNNEVRSPPTYNRASSETVGTHSLMAKDAPTSGPFRNEAIALASHASRNIATIMAAAVVRPGGAHTVVNWDDVLSHYIRFPRTEGSAWEQMVATAQGLAGTRQVHLPHLTGDRPHVTHISVTSTQARERLDMTTRHLLEETYRDLEGFYDRQWRELIRN